MPYVEYHNPTPTVDVIIEMPGSRKTAPLVVLIKRKNYPFGWALPGGFVDEGEPVEKAAIREAKEETGLDIELVELFYVYSNPARDPRMHTLSPVFIARASKKPIAADDAADAAVYTLPYHPQNMAFDHNEILEDFFQYRLTGRRVSAQQKLKQYS